MKRGLVAAQKKLEQQQEYVAYLQEKIAWHEIAHIQKEIEIVNQKRNSQLTLLLQSGRRFFVSNERH